MLYELFVDGIISEIEIFHMNAASSLVYCFKEIIKFFMAIHEQHYRIIVRE